MMARWLAAGVRIGFLLGISAGWCATPSWIAAAAAPARAPAGYSQLVFPGPDGKLQYKPDENGNTIPDFSNCGYGGGGAAIPDVAVKATLTPAAANAKGDDTPRVQKA